MGNKKCTANYDCFNCPFPDCIDDSPFDPLNMSPQKLAKLKSLSEKRKAAEEKKTAKKTAKKKAKLKKYNRAYYLDHQEQAKANSRDYYQENKEHTKKVKRKYYQANRELILLKKKEAYRRKKNESRTDSVHP